MMPPDSAATATQPVASVVPRSVSLASVTSGLPAAIPREANVGSVNIVMSRAQATPVSVNARSRRHRVRRPAVARTVTRPVAKHVRQTPPVRSARLLSSAG